MRWILCIALVGCVKGNPVDLGDFHGTGGTLAIEGCGYSVTTREGAEAPALPIELIGPDPTPKLIHLGLIGDPKTSAVAVWRTNDEVTRSSTIRYAKGANLQPGDLSIDAIKLPYGLVFELVRMAIDRQLLRNLGTRDSGNPLDLKYAFTDEGRRWTVAALEQQRYTGPAPVTIAVFPSRIAM